VPACAQCHEPIRDGAAFCGACGARQPERAETPDAVARYREVVTRFLDGGGLDAEKHDQLEALRLRLGLSLATHAAVVGALEPAAPPPPTVHLAIDVATFRHFAVGARGLARFRVGNDGPLALETVALTAQLSGDALPEVTAPTLFPGKSAVLPVTMTPKVAGFHELAGELRVVDLMGETSVYRFADVHLRAGGDGPSVQIVNIDQSSARVVDNSRSEFGGGGGGGVVGEGDWQAVPLQMTAKTVRSQNPRRVEFAVQTERATYQVTTTLAQGDIATVYGGHVRGTSQQVALKIADQASDNDLIQHETRVLGILTAEAGKSVQHFPVVRDQFRSSDGRLGTVFDHLDGFDLTSVRDRCRARGLPGLPARHLMWVLRRALSALGWAHKNGILHGNLDPAHILIRPHDHMLWLVDWCWAVVNPARTGQGWKALNDGYSPPEVKDHGRPAPASDLYSLGKCIIHAGGGDPDGRTVPDADPRLARFLKYLTVESQGGRPQDAWELYLQVDRLREQIWGAHEFVPLEL
jgi:hypothetical protein